jgi:hypothetical protein
MIKVSNRLTVLIRFVMPGFAPVRRYLRKNGVL